MQKIASRTLPQIDLTAANGVQSLFTRGKPDPWSRALAGDFIDFMLWHDMIRYPVAVLADSSESADGAIVPPLLADLRRRDPDWLRPDIVVLHEPRQLSAELLDAAVAEIGAFAVNNTSQVRGFLRLHNSSWIGDQIRSRSLSESGHFVFDVASLAGNSKMQEIAARLGVPRERIDYLLDLILKYLLYAERAGDGYYLTHPIRSKQKFHFLGSNVTHMQCRDTPIPFRLGPYLVDIAQKRGQDWLTSTLHETRGYLREERMTELEDSGTVSREALRRLAIRLRLPAQVRRFDLGKRSASATSASGGLLGSLAATSMWPAVVGSALTLATNVWSGGVPGQVSKVRWLQWILQWPLEDEAPDDS